MNILRAANCSICSLTMRIGKCPSSCPSWSVSFCNLAVCGHLLFFARWEDPEFEQAQVVFRCAARREVVQVGGMFLLTRCMELGGAAMTLMGLDASMSTVVAAATFPRKIRNPEVLFRVELCTTGQFAHQLRITVRSASYTVNRALHRVLLDLLSEVPQEVNAHQSSGHPVVESSRARSGQEPLLRSVPNRGVAVPAVPRSLFGSSQLVRHVAVDISR
mmetsp:Transcript_91634/g.210038  ORF Transcript_91634/g.210038 Transcript_91634/m.210038 type:complete len:218 (-) Transcript_91634:53-706(-)